MAVIIPFKVSSWPFTSPMVAVVVIVFFNFLFLTSPFLLHFPFLFFSLSSSSLPFRLLPPFFSFSSSLLLLILPSCFWISSSLYSSLSRYFCFTKLTVTALPLLKLLLFITIITVSLLKYKNISTYSSSISKNVSHKSNSYSNLTYEKINGIKININFHIQLFSTSQKTELTFR